MVLDAQGKVGPAHAAPADLELAEGMRPVNLVDDMAVDIDEVAAIRPAAHAMGVLDAVEQAPTHRSHS